MLFEFIDIVVSVRVSGAGLPPHDQESIDFFQKLYNIQNYLRCLCAHGPINGRRLQHFVRQIHDCARNRDRTMLRKLVLQFRFHAQVISLPHARATMLDSFVEQAASPQNLGDSDVSEVLTAVQTLLDTEKTDNMQKDSRDSAVAGAAAASASGSSSAGPNDRQRLRVCLREWASTFLDHLLTAEDGMADLTAPVASMQTTLRPTPDVLGNDVDLLSQYAEIVENGVHVVMSLMTYVAVEMPRIDGFEWRPEDLAWLIKQAQDYVSQGIRLNSAPELDHALVDDVAPPSSSENKNADPLAAPTWTAPFLKASSTSSRAETRDAEKAAKDAARAAGVRVTDSALQKSRQAADAVADPRDKQIVRVVAQWASLVGARLDDTLQFPKNCLNSIQKQLDTLVSEHVLRVLSPALRVTTTLLCGAGARADGWASEFGVLLLNTASRRVARLMRREMAPVAAAIDYLIGVVGAPADWPAARWSELSQILAAASFLISRQKQAVGLQWYKEATHGSFATAAGNCKFHISTICAQLARSIVHFADVGGKTEQNDDHDDVDDGGDDDDDDDAAAAGAAARKRKRDIADAAAAAQSVDAKSKGKKRTSPASQKVQPANKTKKTSSKQSANKLPDHRVVAAAIDEMLADFNDDSDSGDDGGVHNDLRSVEMLLELLADVEQQFDSLESDVGSDVADEAARKLVESSNLADLLPREPADEAAAAAAATPRELITRAIEVLNDDDSSQLLDVVVVRRVLASASAHTMPGLDAAALAVPRTRNAYVKREVSDDEMRRCRQQLQHCAQFLCDRSGGVAPGGGARAPALEFDAAVGQRRRARRVFASHRQRQRHSLEGSTAQHQHARAEQAPRAVRGSSQADRQFCSLRSSERQRCCQRGERQRWRRWRRRRRRRCWRVGLERRAEW